MKKIKGILFDLDGTLLPMDLSVFTKAYFSLLIQKLALHGFSPEKVKDALEKGVFRMATNDGTKTNEAAFWEIFHSINGMRENEVTIFESFYDTEFVKLREVCGFDKRAALCVHKAREKAEKVILATNPLFPRAATEQRITWAGCSVLDFDHVTTFEDFSFCKPNLSYYEQVLKKASLLPGECLMIGNDVDEDMIAEKLGMSVFLLTPCLINKSNGPVDHLPHGDFDELFRFLESL